MPLNWDLEMEEQFIQDIPLDVPPPNCPSLFTSTSLLLPQPEAAELLDHLAYLHSSKEISADPGRGLSYCVLLSFLAVKFST